MRRSCEVSARLRWIEHKLAHEVPQVSAVLTGGGDQLLEVVQARRAVGIAGFYQRRDRVAQPLDARASQAFIAGVAQR